MYMLHTIYLFIYFFILFFLNFEVIQNLAKVPKSFGNQRIKSSVLVNEDGCGTRAKAAAYNWLCRLVTPADYDDWLCWLVTTGYASWLRRLVKAMMN